MSFPRIDGAAVPPAINPHLIARQCTRAVVLSDCRNDDGYLRVSIARCCLLITSVIESAI
jgi:hypothetical protein